ncbi:hypothetical protein [uncultured Algoriphagus sp.]|jgi:hypothetical protein|uniref:hypothetical protein n=1 Tax=uncultured Algoriphagus sp. TaxID=417365 RepID=UPI00258D3AD4|nr:hypothetical protein [uncultured Algoriphagus sp.]
MKNLTKILALAAIVSTAACSQFENQNPIDTDELGVISEDGSLNARVSNEGVIPVLWTSGPGGNATCADTGIDFEESTSRNNYNGGEFEEEWPDGLTIEVLDDKFVNWSFDAPSGQCLEAIAFIVKGGPASHIYIYEDGQTSDEGLVSPLVGKKGRKNADLSNLTVCYSLQSCGGSD